MRSLQTRADYVLLAVLTALALSVLASVGYVVLHSDFVDWDLSEHDDTERYLDRASNPVRFFYGFNSYQSLAETRAVIDASQRASSLSSTRTLPSAAYPQRDMDRLRVTDYSYCGTTGVLTLDFFNDRLMEALFEPADVQVCRTALFQAYPQLRRDDNGRVERVDGHLRLATNLDLVLSEVGVALKTRPYVRWQDLRLVASLQEWERRFASKAQLKPLPGADGEPRNEPAAPAVQQQRSSSLDQRQADGAAQHPRLRTCQLAASSRIAWVVLRSSA